MDKPLLFSGENTANNRQETSSDKAGELPTLFNGFSNMHDQYQTHSLDHLDLCLPLTHCVSNKPTSTNNDFFNDFSCSMDFDHGSQLKNHNTGLTRSISTTPTCYPAFGSHLVYANDFNSHSSGSSSNSVFDLSASQSHGNILNMTLANHLATDLVNIQIFLHLKKNDYLWD
jgi:hypothetical protein